MKAKTVIVVFGNAENGKDTFADMLAVELRAVASTLRLAFADPLKEAAAHLLGIPPEVSYAEASVKEATHYYGRSARHWLQWLGTEVGRKQIHEDVWVHRLADRVLADPATFAVVSDGRFENERTALAPYLAKNSLVPTRVVNVLIYRSSVAVKIEHASEREVYDMRLRTLGLERVGGTPLFDTVIANDRRLEDLAYEARGLAESLAVEIATA